MSTTRFLTTNYATTAAAVLKRVDSQASNNPGTNALVNDRYVTWSTDVGAPLDTHLQVDIGAGKQVSVIGLCNFRSSTPGLPSTVNIGYQSVFPMTAPAYFGATTLARDLFLIIPPQTVRYWDFWFTPCIAPFSVGKVLLGKIDVDLGIAYSPGAVRGLVNQRVRNRTVGGIPVISQIGPDRVEFQLPFRSIPAALRNQLTSLVSANPSFILLDPFDAMYECVLLGDRFEFTHQWAPPDLFDASLELEQLP